MCRDNNELVLNELNFGNFVIRLASASAKEEEIRRDRKKKEGRKRKSASLRRVDGGKKVKKLSSKALIRRKF